MQTKYPLITAFLCLLMVLVSACAVNPVSGSHEIMLYSPEQEVAMGRKAHPQVLEKFGYYNNQKIQAYVTEVGNRVSAHCERQRITYHFTVIDSPVVNAFALPGGYVYISRGLLAECNNEAQLAGVLGHELGHVNARHNMKRLQASLGMNILAAAVGAATGSSLWQNVSGQLMGLASQKYSRSQERQADELGTRYMTLADYDPRQMSAFLHRLYELHSNEPTGFEAIMASHPLTSTRIADTASLAARLMRRYPQARAINRDRYLQAINGLLYGPGEKAGFVIDRIYTNKFCRVRFTIPANMKLESMDNGFILSSGRQQQLIFLYRKLDRYLPPDALADSFMEKYTARLQSQEEITIDQARGISRTYQVRDKRGRWQQLKMTSLAQPDFGYLFLALSPRSQKRGFVTGHFSLLDRKTAASLALPRVTIYQVHKGDTLTEIARRLLHSAADAETLAGYNGLLGKYGLQEPLPLTLKLKIIPAYPNDSRTSSSIRRQSSNNEKNGYSVKNIRFV